RARQDTGRRSARLNCDLDGRHANGHVAEALRQEAGTVKDERKAGDARDLRAFRFQAVGELPGLWIGLYALRGAEFLNVEVVRECGELSLQRTLRRLLDGILSRIRRGDAHGVGDRILGLDLQRI